MVTVYGILHMTLTEVTVCISGLDPQQELLVSVLVLCNLQHMTSATEPNTCTGSSVPVR